MVITLFPAGNNDINPLIESCIVKNKNRAYTARLYFCIMCNYCLNRSEKIPSYRSMRRVSCRAIIPDGYFKFLTHGSCIRIGNDEPRCRML